MTGLHYTLNKENARANFQIMYLLDKRKHQFIKCETRRKGQFHEISTVLREREREKFCGASFYKENNPTVSGLHPYGLI